MTEFLCFIKFKCFIHIKLLNLHSPFMGPTFIPFFRGESCDTALPRLVQLELSSKASIWPLQESVPGLGRWKWNLFLLDYFTLNISESFCTVMRVGLITDKDLTLFWNMPILPQLLLFLRCYLCIYLITTDKAHVRHLLHISNCLYLCCLFFPNKTFPTFIYSK